MTGYFNKSYVREGRQTETEAISGKDAAGIPSSWEMGALVFCCFETNDHKLSGIEQPMCMISF